MCIFGAVKSRNDQYIILFGGQLDHRSFSNKIYVLTVKTMEFKECTIDCQESGTFKAINMSQPKNEELGCHGYIRNLWKLPQFNGILYPPDYLIQIIRSYFCEETIHLLSPNGSGHWRINLD